MSLTRETQDLVTRLGRGSHVHANRSEVQRVLEHARQARLRAARRSAAKAANETSAVVASLLGQNAPAAEESRPWNARDETAVKRAKDARVRTNSFRAPKPCPKKQPETREVFRAGRRRGSDILDAIEHEKKEMIKQGPPLVAKKLGCGNRDFEKNKLQMCCQFLGGKSLPEAGLPGQLDTKHVPLNLILRQPKKGTSHEKKEAESLRHKEQRKRIVQLQNSFNQVMDLIDATKQRLENARGARAKANLMSELNTLLNESKDIDQLLRAEQEYAAKSG